VDLKTGLYPDAKPVSLAADGSCSTVDEKKNCFLDGIMTKIIFENACEKKAGPCLAPPVV